MNWRCKIGWHAWKKHEIVWVTPRVPAYALTCLECPKVRVITT